MIPVVLLHGFTGAPSSWDEVVDALGCEVHRPALFGHAGASTHAATWSDAVDEVARTISALGRPVHLVGYSLGGRVALSLLATIPVASATIVGAHLGLAEEAERIARRAPDARWASMLRTEGLETFLDGWEAQPIFASQRALPDDVRARQRAVRGTHSAEGLARSLEVLGLAEMPDVRPWLRHAPMPIDFVVGALDAKLRPLAEEGAALAPHGHLHVVPGVGHNVPLEAPRVLASIVRDRLRGSSIEVAS